MRMSRKKKLGAAFAALVTAAFALICFPPSREPSYAGKPLSYWCDHLPFTEQLGAPLAAGFFRGYRSSTNQAEQRRFREMEEKALTAIDTLGTNFLPALLSCLQKKRSPLEF